MKKYWLALSCAIDWLSRMAGIIGAIASISLALLIVYDASMRYLFHEGSVALQELEWQLFDLVFLLGLSYALKHDKHVRIDLLYGRFSERTQTWIKIATMLFFVMPMGLLILYFSSDFVWQSFIQHEVSPDPGGLCCRYIIKSFVPLAFLLMILQALSETIKAIDRLGDRQ